MPNRLAQETSPYLLQHQHNPVDWWPWCDEAIARARAEGRPIFLSIGYSACHWCHVMEHESFEDPQIAEFLNEHFVCIKVDREERPDLDQVYMGAVQAMTGSGGWPMSVFLTPELKPFFGGTYWPPYPRQGAAGFMQVLEAIDRFWLEQRGKAEAQAKQLTEHLQETFDAVPSTEVDEGLLRHAAHKLTQQFDMTNGGFGTQPKFPQPMALQFLLRMWRRTGQETLRDMVRLNLDKMARGGIYDHLGGGFARYSVDDRWLVPHFEKMLYDNALLTSAYLDGYLVTGDAAYARVVRETIDYVRGSMTDERGGFHSTEDADSEGEEGRFYLWTPEEIREVLGPECGERFAAVYDVSDRGNFEGRNILNLPQTIEQSAERIGCEAADLRAELDESRAKLLDVRSRRVRPGKDDKILLSWNALMIEAMARAGGVLGEAAYTESAVKAAEFLLAELTRDDGRLLHCWRAGQSRLDAYLDDYAYFVQALVTLYETTFDERWIEHAARLADVMLRHFGDDRHGALFYTADDHERLIVRNKDLHDSSVPSGNSVAASGSVAIGTAVRAFRLDCRGRGDCGIGRPVAGTHPHGDGPDAVRGGPDGWTGAGIGCG
jgi:uncharacterized protein YyaL (SSP411 family)